IREPTTAYCHRAYPIQQAGERVGSALPGGGARKRSHGFTGHGSGPAPAMAGAALRRNAGRRVVQERLSSGKLPVAVLVLLAAAAGARVVAADLGALAHDRGPRAMLVVGLRGFLVGAVAAGVGMLELGLTQARLGLGALLRLDRGHLLLGAHAHPGQQHDHLALDLVEHLAEQLERLALVLLLGLLLRVAAQVDAL